MGHPGNDMGVMCLKTHRPSGTEVRLLEFPQSHEEKSVPQGLKATQRCPVDVRAKSPDINCEFSAGCSVDFGYKPRSQKRDLAQPDPAAIRVSRV
jgi:hypothetical protein